MTRPVLRLAPSLLVASLLASSAYAADPPAGSAEELIQHFGLEQSATAVSERPGWRKPRRILVGGLAAQLAPALNSGSAPSARALKPDTRGAHLLESSDPHRRAFESVQPCPVLPSMLTCNIRRRPP